MEQQLNLPPRRRKLSLTAAPARIAALAVLTACVFTLFGVGAASYNRARTSALPPTVEGRQCLRGTATTPANLPKAFLLFSVAAKDGDPLAAYYLGMMYKNGMAVPRDTRAAARWLQYAAERDLPAAMFLLANLYLSGDGVRRDEQLARKWIEKAADLDYPDAVMAMAIGLRDGSMGFERNEALAEVHMKVAAHSLQRRAPDL
jgi:TPR repeat protein